MATAGQGVGGRGRAGDAHRGRTGEPAGGGGHAHREAEAAFGDGTVFLERYVRDPRHIEVQVLADTHGHTVALFERECSIQRRHQKIIEEAPSPAVSPALRADWWTPRWPPPGRSATSTPAPSSSWSTAGDPYFLEMNTRLQVEHPVTEAVTGLDLVRLQLLIAGGSPLPPEVYDALEDGPQGHAIEARLYAEDPAQGWLPSTGTVHRFEVEGGPRPLDASVPIDTPQLTACRVDSGVESGSVVSPHYDPMLAKVIVHAPTRAEAAAALAATLARARIHGVTTNRDLLARTLRHPAFLAGQTDTGFLDRHGLEVLATPLAAPEAVAGTHWWPPWPGRPDDGPRPASRPPSRRDSATTPRGARRPPTTTATRSSPCGYRFDRYGRELDEVAVDGEPWEVDHVEAWADGTALTTEGVTRRYQVDQVGPDGLRGRSRRWLGPGGGGPVPGGRGPCRGGSALAPMPGSVVRVAVAGERRSPPAQLVVVLEAMKMEHAVLATSAGRVTEVPWPRATRWRRVGCWWWWSQRRPQPRGRRPGRAGRRRDGRRP